MTCREAHEALQEALGSVSSAIHNVGHKKLGRWVKHFLSCRKCYEAFAEVLIVQKPFIPCFILYYRGVGTYVKRKARAPRPPINANFLLYLLLPTERADDAGGDLDERFVKMVEMLGTVRANVWYSKQVACSIWPYARDAARRLSSGLILRVLVFFLRVSGQNGLADEIVRARAKRKTR